MSKRKKPAPSNDDVFRSLYHAASSVLDDSGYLVLDDELLAFIGGLIKDRRRWSHIKLDGDEETAVATWLEKHPLVVPWLKSHGHTIEDAVAGDEQFIQERSSDDDGVKVVGIDPTPGQPREVAIIETANVKGLARPNPYFVKSNFYYVVKGPVATVCPNADPQVPGKTSARLAEYLRTQKTIAEDETIHWIGSSECLSSICECDQETVGQVDTKRDKPKNSKKKRGMTAAAQECVQRYKKYRKQGNPQAMKYVVDEYVEEHPKESNSGLRSRLSNNSDLWRNTEQM